MLAEHGRRPGFPGLEAGERGCDDLGRHPAQVAQRLVPVRATAEVDLGDLAKETWVAGTGDGCFADCFAAACARSGFTLLRMLETDIRGCVDLVESGSAIAICQPTFRPPAGLVHIPLAGAPLRWRQVIGWHPDGPVAPVASRLVGMATAAYQDAIARNPAYLQWMRRHPHLGVTQLAAA